MLSKASKGWGDSLLAVEDPFETTRDLGRPLVLSTLALITAELRRASDLLREARTARCGDNGSHGVARATEAH